MRRLAMAAAFLAVLAGTGAALAAPKATRFDPETLRLNSTFLVRGEGFGTPAQTGWSLVLDGRLTALDGSSRDVRSTVPAARVSDREIRADLPRSLVDEWTLAQGTFTGTVRVAGPDGTATSFPVNDLVVFPPDVMTLLAGWLGFASDTATTPPVWALIGAFVALALFALLAIFALFAGFASWIERRIAGRMQNRVGPNRVGPQGMIQWLADGLKAFQKEDFIPPGALQLLYRVAPYFAMLGVVLTFATLPFGQFLAISDLNVGVFYVLAVTGFTVVGILVGGFASANKWSLLGGFRSAAQIVSYEIPAGLAVTSVVVLAGSLGFGEIIRAQGGWPWDWYLFNNPFTFVAFFIYFISALAEGNRTPFDLPEAESELVAGYTTEYSGMRFLFYFFAEWGNLYVMSALMTALFLGGWQIPGVGAAAQAASLPLTLVGWAVFTAKSLGGVFVVIWLRWTLPRVRIDQLMLVCWKYLVPMGAVCLIGAAAWAAFVGPMVQKVAGFAMFGVGAGLGALFFAKVWRTLKQGNMKVHLNPFV